MLAWIVLMLGFGIA